MSNKIQELMDSVLPLQKEKIKLENQISLRKDEFSNLIKDKSISIFDRWHAFAAAPAELKNHLDYLPYPRGKALKKEIDNMVDVPECYGRGKRIDVLEFFWDAYSVEEKKFYPRGYDHKYELEAASSYNLEEIKGLDMFELMEEILQANLGSFCFDW